MVFASQLLVILLLLDIVVVKGCVGDFRRCVVQCWVLLPSIKCFAYSLSFSCHS